MPRAAIKRRATVWPGNKACLAYADDALSRPPARPWIRRAEPVGPLVWRCVVPAEWCKTLNVFARMNHHAANNLKKKILQHMLAQHGLRKRETPLEGRPFVRCIRFTSAPTDAQTGWSKAVVDCLIADFERNGRKQRQRHEGIGFLEDDRSELCDLQCHWEPGKRGQGFVLCEVYTGVPL